MPIQTWSADLAAAAQEWADRCNYGHRPNGNGQTDSLYGTIPGYAGIFLGENLAASTATLTEANFDPRMLYLASQWYNEINDWTYGTFQGTDVCTDVCGHYTQVSKFAANALSV